jgi:hypothetical protein
MMKILEILILIKKMKIYKKIINKRLFTNKIYYYITFKIKSKYFSFLKIYFLLKIVNYFFFIFNFYKKN